MKRILIASAALLVLSACATKPDPVEEVIERPAEVETPGPVFERAPEVLPPVVDQPTIVEAPQVNLPTPGSIEDFAYQAGGEPRVFFGYDQFDLSPEARDVLRRQANWLSIYTDATAVIEGHADERGTREYNLALGARRAAAARDYLVANGVADNRLRTVTFGKERPLAVCSTEECYAKNRRAVTVIAAGVGS